MARRGDRGSGSSRYFLGFGITALVLGGTTLALVLVVLPRRYVLSAGLRESGMSFPSAAAPFAPPEEIRREPPPPPPPEPEVVRGPAEVFWSEVEPLLRQERYARALPLFEAYLADHPEDGNVLREYGLTLQHADRPDQAARVFSRLLEENDDPEVRLLLARVLRDLGRIDDASAQYALLHEHSPDDVSLTLEWGRALAWARQYERAADVLTEALDASPESDDVRVELARIYYWSDRLDDADRILADVGQAGLRRLGALDLRADIERALAPPVEETPAAATDSTPLTTVDQAVQALAQGDYQAAAPLYREALRETPQDTSLWRAYADVLQFGLDDLEGAREALLRIEELGGAGPALRYRLAQLDVWTGRNGEASRRLRRLLGQLAEADRGSASAVAEPGDSAGFGPGETAEMRALLGDLRRWEGDRVRSGDEYLLALSLDSTNLRAQTGVEVLEDEASREVEEIERPRLGGDTYSITDSDEFSRLELGAEGVRIDGNWVLRARTGSRWLTGLDLSGASRDEQGLFLEVESARWWNWGTLRTGVHFGVEQARPRASDISFGSTLRFSDLGGFRSDFRYDHGPAYSLTSTLQSVYADVIQDRVTANLARTLSPRWSLSVAGDAAWLDARAVADTRGSLRLESAIGLGRALTDDLTLGVNARALTYTTASPLVNGLRLFWDPRSVVAGGIYAQWDHELTEPWQLSIRMNPSLAFIDERTQRGIQGVPHVSAEAGLSHLGRRFRTSLDAFYYQGRFDGYRAYGLRVSFSARDWFGGRGAR